MSLTTEGSHPELKEYMTRPDRGTAIGFSSTGSGLEDSKDKARIDEWRKDLAPSDRLRKWFNHEPAKWEEFRRRYREELRPKIKEVNDLGEKKRPRTIALLYGARDKEHNNAVALKEFLEDLR
jgi:uncharacterized protein YeaO (DUF488 family)